MSTNSNKTALTTTSGTKANTSSKEQSNRKNSKNDIKIIQNLEQNLQPLSNSSSSSSLNLKTDKSENDYETNNFNAEFSSSPPLATTTLIPPNRTNFIQNESISKKTFDVFY